MGLVDAERDRSRSYCTGAERVGGVGTTNTEQAIEGDQVRRCTLTCEGRHQWLVVLVIFTYWLKEQGTLG